mmetsp:Transcript_20048/g.52066  ORF Transcript_20048/g.52066 Transcript_20048/m.52066 type:complete len:216 (-) Transcript_20048:234-881(-)
MELSQRLSKFEKRNPVFGKPLGALVRAVTSKWTVRSVRMVLLPCIMLGNYFGLIDFVSYARVILCLWVCVAAGAVAMLFVIRKKAFEAYARGNLKGDVAVHTEKYGEPDRIDVYTLLEHDLEELQKLLNAAVILAVMTLSIYWYSSNVTALVVQLVIIPVQLHSSALYQIYMAGERAIGPYSRPFQQIGPGNMMGDWVKVQKANFKPDKKGRKGK